MARILKKSLDLSPDETQTFDRGKMDLAKLGEITIGRVVLQPGWSWEESIKPIQKTELVNHRLIFSISFQAELEFT
jgi:hypothetical protein